MMSKIKLVRSLGWALAGAAIIMGVLGTTLSLIYILRTGNLRPLLSHQGLVPFITAIYALLGGLIVSRHPGNVIGWLYAITSVLYGLLAVAIGNTFFQSLDQSVWLPWSGALNWLSRWIWIVALTLPFGIALPFFPDGRLLTRRGWLLVGIGVTGLAGAVVGVALHPGPIETWSIPGVNPSGVPGAGPVLELLINASGVLLGLSMLGAMLVVGVRFHRSSGVEREQLKWVVYTTLALFLVFGLASALAPFFLSEPDATELSILLTDLFILGIAVSVTIAIRRHRLYDIDLVVSRTLVYGALTAAVIGVYLLIVGGLGVLLQARGSLALSLLGVGLVAIVVQPARDRLQQAVNRLMYGERDDPYTALARLGRRLEGTLAPEAVLPTIVETVAQTLKLPYAAIALASSTEAAGVEPIIAAYGAPAADPLRLPLVYQAETIGALIAGPRAGESFSAADRRLLEALARQAGAAVHAVQLTAALRRSREQLVTAREEERRRLRRDLHDGLGSQFAGLHLRADTLRGLIVKDPAAAQAVAAELRDEIRTAVADIRRLVYELRPPALDELGLAGALRALAAQHTSPSGLQVTIQAPEPLPPLPAAVEVAAYRIAQEALTNVVRHAEAHLCAIRLELNGHLRLEVSDDGVGFQRQGRSGVGLHSMRERAEELGGTCRVEATAAGGTRVIATFPLVLGASQRHPGPIPSSIYG